MSSLSAVAAVADSDSSSIRGGLRTLFSVQLSLTSAWVLQKIINVNNYELVCGNETLFAVSIEVDYTYY